MNAVLRRQGGEADGRKREEGPWIRAGGLALNTARQTVTVDGVDHDLSSTEYRAPQGPHDHTPNTVLSRDQLMNLAMGRGLHGL